MEFNPPPVESGWGQDARRGPILVWALWFQKVWNMLSGTVAPKSWTPVASNLTIVTGATLTGNYTRVGNVIHFKISITTTGTTASTAGTTTITLPSFLDAGGNAVPLIAAENDICTVVDAGSFASYGNGIIAANTGLLYPPTWAATAGEVVISGTYRTTG